MTTETVRTTIVLPAETAAKLRELVPVRKRSQFVTEALEQHLMRLAFRQRCALSFGVWTEADYPHLRTYEDVQRFIVHLRADEGWRSPSTGRGDGA